MNPPSNLAEIVKNQSIRPLSGPQGGMQFGKSTVLLGLCAAWVIGSAGTASAATIFAASATNTTAVGNNGTGSGSGDSAGAGDLTWTGPAIAFNNGGFTSTSNINTLLGTPLASTDTVTVTLDVTSLAGTIRANGITFGVHDGTTWSDGTVGATASSMIIQVEAANSGNDINIWGTSFQDAGDTGSNTTAGDAVIYDGFTLTLVADVNGYEFTLESLAASTITASGTFAGTEFVDNFGSSHFYYAAQRFNTGGGLVSTISEASIDVVPEPSSFALLGLGVVGLMARRRRC